MPTTEELCALFGADKQYRAWFLRWWEQDFSRKAASMRMLPIPRQEFGGREWLIGWAPPHDNKGLPNPRFQPLTRNDLSQYYWSHIKDDLSGAFIADDAARIIRESLPRISYCMFLQGVSAEIPQGQFDGAQICCLGAADIKFTGHGSRVDLSKAYFESRAMIRMPAASMIDLSGSTLAGDLLVSGDFSLAEVANLTVLGDAKFSGGIQGASFRVKNLSIHHATTGKEFVSVAGLKAKDVKIQGAYASVDVTNAMVSDCVVILSGCREANLSGMKAKSLSVTGSVDDLNLSMAVVTDDLNVSGATFKSFSLSGVTVGRKLTVSGVTSTKGDVSGARVRGGATFLRSKFGDEFIGSGAHFDAHASFVLCGFPGKLAFDRAIFGGGADFRVGSGQAATADDKLGQVGEADFRQAKFSPGDGEVCANFEGRETLEAATFEQADFQGIPKFFGCKFHENISFRGAEFHILPPQTTYAQALLGLGWREFAVGIAKAVGFPPRLRVSQLYNHWLNLRRPLADRRAVQNLRLAQYERAYNALRQRFDEVGNPKEERRFHTMELRARRRRLDKDAPAIESILSYLYDLVSQYGQSISRPLLVLFFGSWLFFALLYLMMAETYTVEAMFEASVFAGRQIVKPFTAWSRDFTLPATATVPGKDVPLSEWTKALLQVDLKAELAQTTLVRILATLQSLTAIVMLFLSGLAIRRTFGVT